MAVTKDDKYLVIPYHLLQSMSLTWQSEFNSMLNMLKSKRDACLKADEYYHVQKRSKDGKYWSAKNGETRTCLNCGKKFYVPRYRINQGIASGIHRGKFCSRSCFDPELI